MSVLLLPPIFQFFDNNGDPLANGFIDVFAAGTTTRIATYTSAAGTIEAPNPIQLNAAGRPTSGGGAIWGEGAYKFIVRDANGVQVGDVLDNVTSFAGLVTATNAYAELFSGNGTQTVFTTSSDLGTDPKGLLVSVASGLQEIAQNGSFTTDTLWTKGAGWTIGSGVATATGAISTAISQIPVLTVLAGQAYAVTYTITRSAGGLIPSIGGQNGVERTASGTYREIIIAAASTPLAFTGNAFTGTLDNVSVTIATSQPMALLPTNAYSINGTTLTFASAPALGVSNIDVRAPSLLVGAASTAASLAQVYAANALTSQTAAAISASSAAGYAAARNQWTFSTTTTMADPSTANLRLNNAAFASVTAIAISDFSANVGNPDLSGWINTWDDAGGSNRGSIFIFKDNGNFAIYNVNSALIDNTTWFQVFVTHVSSAGSFSASDALLIGFSAAGTNLVSGGITQLTSDVIASGAGSVVATIANSAVTNAKMADMAANTVKANNTASPAAPSDVALAASQVLGRASTGNIAGFTAPNDLAYIGTRLSMQGADKKRQIILNAPVDSSGYNSMLPSTSGSLNITTQNLSTSAPLVVTTGAGYNQFGDQSNRKGFATANLTFSGNTPSVAIVSITRVGTLATCTANNHGLVTGTEVTHSGVTPAGFNGTYPITVTGPNTYTYVMAADPGANASPVGSYTVTNFLWVDVGTDGTLTTGRTLLPPIYTQGSTPPTTANQFTYNITEAKGYYGNGSTAPQTYKVFVGEVQASTSTITSSVAYAVNGIYFSGYTSTLPGAATAIARNHLLGLAEGMLDVRFFIKCLVSDKAFVPGQIVDNLLGYQTDYTVNLNPRTMRNTVGFTTSVATPWVFATASTGSSAPDPVLASWAYGITVKRTW
jgi:hypothetical protein